MTEDAQTFALLFSHKKFSINFVKFGRFFTNASGHPDPIYLLPNRNNTTTFGVFLQKLLLLFAKN
jgi:hypothetical protein